MIVALTGASGFLGRHLSARLNTSGHTVRAVSLRSAPGSDAFAGCDAVVNLAGEPVAQRWTAAARKRIVDSRVEGTRSVVRALAALEHRAGTLISASAVGYYGSRGDEILTESSTPAADFLGQVATAWEREAREAEKFGIRVVTPRIGVVLGRDGGALQQMLLPFKLGVGGRLGSGKQWVSWIHLDDLIGLLVFALDGPQLAGPANATAPHPVTNAEFTRELGSALHRPAIFPVPPIAMKLMFGEMSEILLGGQRVLPEAASRAGFQFKYAELGPALRNVLVDNG